MARMTVKRNFKFLELLNEVAPTESDLRAAGEALAVKIENRTLAGLDENGRPFAPYADGRQKFGKGTVDLHDTGRMFADFGVVKTTRNSVSLGFRSERSARLAGYHDRGAGRLPVRRFLGIPDDWADDFKRRLLARRGR